MTAWRCLGKIRDIERELEVTKEKQKFFERADYSSGTDTSSEESINVDFTSADPCSSSAHVSYRPSWSGELMSVEYAAGLSCT